MIPNYRLRRARKLRGWSQVSVAQQLDTDANTVSRWERGLFAPLPFFREKLCVLFDTNAEELGLIEIQQPFECQQHVPALQPQAINLAFLLPEEREQEEQSDRTILAFRPPSWSDRTDTYTYIQQSAAYDQYAYKLWKEAYVQMLCGHRAAAQRLGEASLRAFERIHHPNASVLQNWLTQEVLIQELVAR